MTTLLVIVEFVKEVIVSLIAASCSRKP